MDLGLKDKIGLVTAGSRGFGLATAKQLAAEGAHVALCARGAEDLAAATAEIDAAGVGRVWAAQVDVTDGVGVARFVAEVEHELGPVDVALINAGGPPAGVFEAIDLEQWEAAYRLNLESAVRLCSLLLPGMRDRGYGRIVQVTSVTVKQPLDNLMLSNVIRPAAHALIHHLAREAAPDGVTLNSVAPGFHTHQRHRPLVADRIAKGEAADRAEVLAGWEKEIPAGRLGEPEELAALAVFLMSEAAGYVTGQCIVSDGGWVRGTV